MATRSSWKGNLKLCLVTIPVKAYSTAAGGDAGIHLHQLHAGCNSRINYKKVCPHHGDLAAADIVSGYECSQGQYVIVDTAELDKLRGDDDKSLVIDLFVNPEAIEPTYFSGKHYYVLPDGPVAQRHFAVLYHGMIEMHRCALAQVVLHGREQLVLLSAAHGLLMMSGLHLDFQVTAPSVFAEESPRTDLSMDELSLVKAVIGNRTPVKVNWSRYEDRYAQRLAKLIEAKVSGQEIVAAPASAPPQAMSLVDSLQQSLKRKRGKRGRAA